MVDYKYKDLFYKRNTDKQLKIATDDGVFTAKNSDIHFEDFELEESLCSESELRFGSCEASMVKFQILNAFVPLSEKWLTVTETIGENTDTPFKYGRYKVFSDKPTADKEYRDIVAYDSMHDIINADMTAWYNSILPNKNSKKTLKQFRESFIQHFGISEVIPSGGLVNDNMTVERTIDPEQISGKDVITAICEINGCFGHIGRDGKFHYIYLKQNVGGLYPANDLYPNHAPDYLPQQKDAGSLYPQDPKGERMGTGRYIKCQYEDYVVKNINKLQIRQEENDVGAIWPETDITENDNSYIIQDNFLVYGKSASDLKNIAKKIYEKIKDVVYRPFSAECPGNPCFEVGDPVRFLTKYSIVESYILRRTLKGIQSPRDNCEATGEEKRAQNVNSVSKSIIQLKGKTNKLTRTVDETRSELSDLAEDTNTRFIQTANAITLEANRAEGKERELSAKIEVTAQQITSEVSRATLAEGTLSSKITQNATKIESKVTKGDVSSEISQEAGDISIKANRISIKSDKFELTKNGKITATEGKVGGWIIGKDRLYSQSNGSKKYTFLRDASNGGYVFGAGGPGFEENDYTKYPFRVDAEGFTYVETIRSSRLGGLEILRGSDPNNRAGQIVMAQNNEYFIIGANEGTSILSQDTNYYTPIRASSFDVNSSRLVKENVKEMGEDEARKILEINPVEFDYIKEVGGAKGCRGLIAEDVLEIIPSCVSVPDGYAEEEFDKAKGANNKILSIDYSKLVPYLIKMVQIQEEKISEQKKEIDDLKESVSFLMEKINF